MASQLKRVSQATESAVSTIADREDRTFVAQLDRIVAAGLKALGEDVPTELATTPAPKAKGTRKAKAPATANA